MTNIDIVQIENEKREVELKVVDQMLEMMMDGMKIDWKNLFY